MNYDMTFCLSDKCSRKSTCDRYFYNHCEKIDRTISMACFYKQDKECKYYIKPNKESEE